MDPMGYISHFSAVEEHETSHRLHYTKNPRIENSPQKVGDNPGESSWTNNLKHGLD